MLNYCILSESFLNEDHSEGCHDSINPCLDEAHQTTIKDLTVVSAKANFKKLTKDVFLLAARSTILGDENVEGSAQNPENNSQSEGHIVNLGII